MRDRLCADAVRFARAVGYVNAGTVEFLVDAASGEHVFIEMNPRIQVEHTVTEEITDVDLVRSQLLDRRRARRSPSWASRQDRIRSAASALQCRITTEDPAPGFRPDTGTISAYRAPGGAGIRLDEGSAYVGAEISPYFDPLLLKVTARGHDLADRHHAGAPRGGGGPGARRADEPGRSCGAVLDDPDFRAGRATHDVRRRAPAARWRAAPGGDRASRLLLPARRGDGQPPARDGARRARSRTQAARAAAAAATPPAGSAPAPAGARPRGLRPLAARARPPCR